MSTTNINPNLDGARYLPTSLIASIKASTDKSRVDVSLSCEAGLDGEPETFYSTSLYAYDGIVEFNDVGPLIEEYFRMRDKVADMISITIDDISMDVHCLYCEYDMPDAFDPDDTFFISAMTQRVHQDSTVAISAVDRGSATPFIIKAVGHSADDNSLAVASRSLFRQFGPGYTVYITVDEIIRWALNQTEEEAGVDLTDVLYFSIEYGGIRKMCYFVPDTAYYTFSFRNIFNVTEFIDIVGVVTTKTDVSRDTAVCSGRSRQYDRVVTRTYQVTTAPIPSDEIAMFEQFVASHDINMRLEGNDWPVIITDHTCEPSTDDESLATLKFTWRFADRRPRVFESEINGILPSRRKIFDDKFTPEYE